MIGLFPGQGSQTVGMGKFLYENFKIVQNLYEEASDTLKLDFKRLCFSGPDEDLNLTANTQPALLLVGNSAYQILKENAGLKCQQFAGHSVGEYAACVAAGALSFTDALTAVRKRGEYMQSAVPVGQGGMVAVMGLDASQVKQLCAWAEKTSGLKPLEPANYNSPGQIVCSGSAELIEWLKLNIAQAEIEPKPTRLKLIPLKVSAPFHCSMMKPAEEKMQQVLQTMKFSPIDNPVVQNFSASATKDPKTIKANLVQQVSGPVRWIETVESFVQANFLRGIEFGPGSVLSGLNKKNH